jgi:diguanylate cyclase (GGDEF)-like protein
VPASPERRRTAQRLLVQELTLELARLDLNNTARLGAALVQAVASVFTTDRVSLLIFKPDSQEVRSAFHCGFVDPEPDFHVSQRVTLHTVEAREMLLVYDVRSEPGLSSPWPDSYRTDAFAVLPVLVQRQVAALLCISNLSAQQLMQLANSADELTVVESQLEQLVQLLAGPDLPPAPERLSLDELTVIGTLIDALERHVDMRNVFTVFCDVISSFLPVDLLAVIHDCIRDPQQGVICVQRPVHRQELNQLFTQLAYQWQRRHKRAILLSAEDAQLAGTELVKEAGDCPPELLLDQVETFPVFIDNDLFALVAVAAGREQLLDRRRLKLFNLLISHLMLHVKKSLLLAQNQEMQTLDSLTGLYNERHFFQTMEREFDRAARYNVPLSLLFVDVDHFKDVNETYGFEAGDLLLKEISRIVMENMRSTDFCSRYSGERFVVVLPETHSKNSEIMANRLRRFIENHSFFIPNTNVFIKVTVSIGVASYLDHRPASLAQFIEFADTALYFAKRIGRNQVVGYSYVTNLMMKDTEHQS